MNLQLNTLGRFSGTLDGRSLEWLQTQRQRAALLVILAVERAATRDRLVGVLWPESDPERARRTLNQTVYQLRQSIAEDVIETQGDRLSIANWVRTDLVDFSERAGKGESEQALQLYVGAFLAETYLVDTKPFEEWIDDQRARAQRLHRTARREAIRAYSASNNLPAGIVCARQWVEREPLEDEAQHALIDLLFQGGLRSDALHQYELYRRRLAEDQLEPLDETKALVTRIRGTPHQSLLAAGATFHTDASALRKTLERMPTERFPTAGEFVRTPATHTIVRPRWLGWAQSRRAAAASGIMLSFLIGLVVWWAPGSRTTRDGAVSPSSLVVFPFVVHGDPRLAEWGVGLMTMLGDALNGVGELRVVDPIALMDELSRNQKPGLDLRNARRIAQRFGAGHYLVGSVILLGDLAQVTLSLYSLQTGDAIRTKTVEGKPDQLSAVAMDLARDMLVALLGTGLLADEVLTANPANYDAQKYWVQGLSHFFSGRYDSAVMALRRSVAADSTFALASYRLSYALDFCARCDSAEITATIDRAFRHRATASESGRLLIEGYYAYLHGDGKMAEQAALAATERFPNSVEAWWLLGFTQGWHAWQWGRPPTDGREALERALKLNPYHRPTLYGLAGRARFEGNYAVAESLALRANPTGTYLDSRARLMLAFIRRDTATQSLFMRLLPDSSTGRIMLDATGVASHTDDLAGAAGLARLALDPARRSEGARASAEMFLTLAEISAGRPLSKRQIGDSATALDPQTAVAYRAWFVAQPFFRTSRAELSALADTLERWSGKARNLEATDFVYRPPAALRPHLRSYVLGLLRARLGQEQAALAHATALERAYESADSAGMLPDFALEIRALAALQAGRASDALDILERARLAIRWHYQVFSSPMSMRPFGRFLRAEILYQLARYEEALGWYAPFRNGVYDVRIAEFVYRGPALLRSAQINDRLGQSAEARRDYERFLSRWPNAEPALSPYVEEARRALVQLR